MAIRSLESLRSCVCGCVGVSTAGITQIDKCRFFTLASTHQMPYKSACMWWNNSFWQIFCERAEKAGRERKTIGFNGLVYSGEGRKRLFMIFIIDKKKTFFNHLITCCSAMCVGMGREIRRVVFHFAFEAKNNSRKILAKKTKIIEKDSELSLWLVRGSHQSVNRVMGKLFLSRIRE